MERYLLFAWDQYYPMGGFNDLRSDHATLEDAQTAWELINADWGQIVDITTGQKWDL